jgi:hypothetical protein
VHGILTGFALTISICQASTIIAPADDPLVTAQMYRDEAALYPMVGKVTGSGLSGSGVLISDRWVLTAGHIAFGKSSGTFNVGGVNYSIKSSITHPSYSFGSNPHDLGLIELSSSVSGVNAARMIQLGGANSILGRESDLGRHRAHRNRTDRRTGTAGVPGLYERDRCHRDRLRSH